MSNELSKIHQIMLSTQLISGFYEKLDSELQEKIRDVDTPDEEILDIVNSQIDEETELKLKDIGFDGKFEGGHANTFRVQSIIQEGIHSPNAELRRASSQAHEVARGNIFDHDGLAPTSFPETNVPIHRLSDMLKKPVMLDPEEKHKGFNVRRLSEDPDFRRIMEEKGIDFTSSGDINLDRTYHLPKTEGIEFDESKQSFKDFLEELKEAKSKGESFESFKSRKRDHGNNDPSMG